MRKVLQRFNMQSTKPVGSTQLISSKLSERQCSKTKTEKAKISKVPYASIVGSLMYVMVCTRSNIVYVVGVVHRYMSNPGREHWVTVKWILWYLRGTSTLYLQFGLGKPILEGFTDSDMSADVDTSQSTFGYVMTNAGGAVSWKSRL